MSFKYLFTIALLLVISSIAFGQRVHKQPPMNGNMPRINNTGWRIFKLYNTGHAPAKDNAADVLVFCRNNRFSYVPSTGIGPQGTFQVQGSSLMLTNSSADKLSTTYKMIWIAGQNILRLEGGGVVMEMEYSGESNCNG